MNIYQELFTTKLYEKLWPSAVDTKNSSINVNESSNTAINNFTESFFEKLALVEFDTSVYNQLDYSQILRGFYEKIVKNEIKSIQSKTNKILVHPSVKVNSIDMDETIGKGLNKDFSLTILDFGKF